ncbi:MAG: succinate dehydrogenase, cytochrome b556 subunit [Gammaproteobacteria bacterium]|nr:succinate dehydrogenase, cytochrome b556 subunit [Gammaproteobacteria bacterium]
MSDTGRPLSPHLSVYRWPITMTLSILHRMTGVALSVGLLILVGGLVAAASGADRYDRFSDLLGSFAGRLVLIAWSAAFFYHLLNGIRHLVWDFGLGLEKEQANKSAWLVLVLTVVITVAYWLTF